jgi:hypothetical protein
MAGASGAKSFNDNPFARPKAANVPFFIAFGIWSNLWRTGRENLIGTSLKVSTPPNQQKR